MLKIRTHSIPYISCDQDECPCPSHILSPHLLPYYTVLYNEFRRAYSIFYSLTFTWYIRLQASAYAARDSYWMRFGLSSTYDSIGSTVFVQKTAGELLFDGYDDTLLALAGMFGGGGTGDLPMDKFGWFYKVQWSIVHLMSSNALDKLFKRRNPPTGKIVFVTCHG